MNSFQKGLRKTGNIPWRFVILSLPLLFLLVFFFFPLSTILGRSLRWEEVSQWPESTYWVKLFLFTGGQAAVSTLLTLLLALPGAYVMARFRFPGQSMLQALAAIPFVLPTILVAMAFLSLLGPNGIVNDLLQSVHLPPLDIQHTLAMVLVAHVFYNYGVVLRIVGSFWRTLDPHLVQAARMLGAGRIWAWIEIVLPQLAPSILSAALLVFIFCFTSFGTIMILGGPRLVTLEVEIYVQTAHMLNLPLAALLSLGQMAVTVLLMSVYTALQRHISRSLNLRSPNLVQKTPSSWHARLLVRVNVVFILAFTLLPLLALVWRSLTLGNSWTVQHYVALARDPGRSYFYVLPGQATKNSLLFACATTVLSLFLGVLAAYLLSGRRLWMRRMAAWLDPLMVLPLGTSAVTLGLGYLLAFARRPFNWIASPWLVPVVHTLIAFPFVLRSVLPALRAIRPSLREAAATLGASPLRVRLSVDLPLLGRALGVGGAYAFAISMGEFGATLLLARREYATLPVAIYRYLSNPGVSNLGQALAMSVLLMVLCAASFVLIERFQQGVGSEF